MARPRYRALSVGGLTLAVEAPPDLPWDWPAGPLRRFRAPLARPDLRVRVRVGRPEEPPSSALRYDSRGGIFDVAEVGGEWIVALRIRGELQRVARFDADLREGEVVVAPTSSYARERHYPLAYPLDEVVFFHRLAREGGLLVHACGAAASGGLRLFTGPSGAGKTTFARLARRHAGAAILSDDRIVLRPDGRSGVLAWGTPWHGDAPLSLATRVPLAAVYAIYHARDMEPRPLSGAAAATALLGNAFLPAHDPVATERALAFAARLVETVPVVRLGFPKDVRAVRYAFAPAVEASPWGTATAAAAAAP